MAQKSIPLCSNISVVADQPAVTYYGGRGLLFIEATGYPSTCQLQTQGPSGKWINVGSNISADGVIPLDLAAGQYRMHLLGGACSALYAVLVSDAYQ